MRIVTYEVVCCCRKSAVRSRIQGHKAEYLLHCKDLQLLICFLWELLGIFLLLRSTCPYFLVIVLSVIIYLPIIINPTMGISQVLIL